MFCHLLKNKPSVKQKLNLRGPIEGSFISGFNTLVIPGGKMAYAMELILTRNILDLLARRGKIDRREGDLTNAG